MMRRDSTECDMMRRDSTECDVSHLEMNQKRNLQLRQAGPTHGHRCFALQER